MWILPDSFLTLWLADGGVPDEWYDIEIVDVKADILAMDDEIDLSDYPFGSDVLTNDEIDAVWEEAHLINDEMI